MLERPGSGLHPRVHAVSHGPALHEDDRMVAVLARDRRRQSDDESRLGLSRNLLEAMGRQVVALVDNQVAVVGDPVVHNALLDEALDDGDIEQPGRRVAPPPMRPIDFAGTPRNVESRSTH